MHDCIRDFEVSYSLGTGDADSSFSMTYIQMVTNANGTCVSDAIVSSKGTLTSSTKYTVTSDDGTSSNPCGYYI